MRKKNHKTEKDKQVSKIGEDLISEMEKYLLAMDKIKVNNKKNTALQKRILEISTVILDFSKKKFRPGLKKISKLTKKE